MKHFFLLLLAALALISCSDDSDPVSTNQGGNYISSPKKITVYSLEDGTRVYNFVHDRNGNILSEISENYSRKTYTYDSCGNRLSEVHDKYANNSWVNIESVVYEYNNKNLLTSKLYKWYNGLVKSCFTYDKNGNLLTETNLRESAGTMPYERRSSFVYNNSNKEMTALWEVFKNNVWEFEAKREYTYNEKGQRISGLVESIYNDQLEKMLHLHSYADNGDLLCTLWKDWLNNSWVDIMRYNYIYDNRHNLISSCYQNCQGNTWDDVSKIDYKYYSDNLVKEMENFFSPGKSWQTVDRGLYINNLSKNINLFNAAGYKMTVEYASFQVPASSSSVAPAVSLPELVSDEMSKRLAPRKSAY